MGLPVMEERVFQKQMLQQTALHSKRHYNSIPWNHYQAETFKKVLVIDTCVYVHYVDC